jgi:3-hydroxyisobutyrate dehydrogenase
MGFPIAFAGMKWGGIFVDHTAAPATVARELDRDAKSGGLAFIDAPVSGGQSGAQNGQLTNMCGGDDRDYAQAEPVLAAYARSCRLMGPVGAGQLTKMVNQIFIAGLVQALAEGLSLRRRQGSMHSAWST